MSTPTGLVERGPGVGHWRGQDVLKVHLTGVGDLFGEIIARINATGCARWSGSRVHGWMLPATFEGALAVRDVVAATNGKVQWEWSPGASHLMDEATAAAQVRDIDPAALSPIPEKVFEEHMHQRRGFHLLRSQPANFFDWEMGTGKTFPVVAYVNCEAAIQNTLILCPPSVVAVWANEFQKHTPDPGWRIVRHGGNTDPPGRMRGTVAALSSGTSRWRAERAAAERGFAQAAGRKFVLVLNYQIVWRAELAKWLMSVLWDLAVCDEAHFIKAPGGVTSKFMRSLRPRCKRRLCLTGTPMEKPHDIYAQMRFVDPGVFGESFQRFKHTYPFESAVTLGTTERALTVRGDFQYTKRCSDLRVSGRYFDRSDRAWKFPASWEAASTLCESFRDCPVYMTDEFKAACDNMGYDQYGTLQTIDREKIEAQFIAKLRRHVDKVLSDDVLDLPPMTESFRSVELSAKARKIYKQMHRNLVADVENGLVTAANGLVKLIRMQQITSGIVPVSSEDDDGTEVSEAVRIDTAKTDAMIEWLESLPPGEPVVIFCRFSADMDSAAEAIRELRGPESVCFIRGGNNQVGAVWRDDGSTAAARANACIVQIQAGGVGIDLTRARYVMFYSLTLRMLEFKQAVKRVHRQGQKHRTHIVHLVAAGTFDEQVYEAIASKAEIVSSVLRRLK